MNKYNQYYSDVVVGDKIVNDKYKAFIIITKQPHNILAFNLKFEREDTTLFWELEPTNCFNCLNLLYLSFIE